MQVFGNVYSNAMLFKVEGKPMHAAEMTDEQLQFRRDQLRRIIKLRRSVLSGARGLFALVALYLLVITPEAIQDGTPAIVPDWTVPFVMSGTILVSVGVLYRVQVGQWARQQRKTISRLQVRLAELDAEREMRRIERPAGLVGAIKEIASILRE